MFFEKNNGEERPRNPDMMFAIRVMAAGYILYMVYQIVQMYFTEPGQHDLWLMILAVALLTPGALYVLISGYIGWRREKKALEEEQTALEMSETEETIPEEDTETE